MATTYTTNTNLAKPANGDRGWDAPIRANLDAIDALAAVGNLAVATAETPSATLNVKVSAGAYRKADGTLVSYAGAASQAVTTAATNYLYLLDSTGALTLSTSGFPSSGTAHVRLAVVVAGATTITSIADSRVATVSAGANLNTVYLALAGGTFSDASGVVTLTTGTTNGVKFGASATDKIGFWNATPVPQPSGAAQSAIGTLATTALTDSSGGTASGAVAAISDTATKNAIASILAQLVNVIADLNSIKTLANATRSAKVAAGTMKGGA